MGEGIDSGFPGLLIRLSGCNLRCSYCDTRYAWRGGKKIGIKELAALARRKGYEKILLTGGEPLCQDETIELMAALIKAGRKVLLETNGSLSIAQIPYPAHIIMDLKTPGSGEESANRYENLEFLKPGDELKFVLCRGQDYNWAKKMVKGMKLEQRFLVNFSPAAGTLDPRRLAKWLIRDRLKVRLNLQLHRIIFPGKLRGV